MRRRELSLAAGLTLLSALGSRVAAQSVPPTARLRLVPESGSSRFEVGEAIVVRLEVWVSTWFQSSVEFPDTLAAEGALVEAIGGSPESNFEEYDGMRWTGLVRRYRVLPAQDGELVIGMTRPLSVRAGGGNGLPQQLAPPPPLRLAVRLPAGADDIQPFVAAYRFELRQQWWPKGAPSSTTGSAQVGDLLRREVVLVTDSISPLLAVPDFAAPDGVAVRVRATQTQEQRADAASTPTVTRRVEAVYTFEREGAVDLPPVEMVWWNLAQRRKQVARLEGLTMSVGPPPVLKDPFARNESAEIASDSRGSSTWLLAGAVLGVGALAIRWWRSRRHAVAGTSTAGRRPEVNAWQQLRHACRHGDAAIADASLRLIISSLDEVTRQRWMLDRDFHAAVNDLARMRFGVPAPNGVDACRWHGDALWDAVSRVRSQLHPTPSRCELPPLHPGGQNG